MVVRHAMLLSFDNCSDILYVAIIKKELIIELNKIPDLSILLKMSIKNQEKISR